MSIQKDLFEPWSVEWDKPRLAVTNFRKEGAFLIKPEYKDCDGQYVKVHHPRMMESAQEGGHSLYAGTLVWDLVDFPEGFPLYIADEDLDWNPLLYSKKALDLLKAMLEKWNIGTDADEVFVEFGGSIDVVVKAYDSSRNTLIKDLSALLCSEFKGDVKPDHECKSCRNARCVFDPKTNEDVYIDLPEGCLGKGYEDIAQAILDLLDKPIVFNKS